MSRFAELHQAYLDARQAFFAERDRCAAFAASLLDGLERYLECPPAHLRFVPHGGLTTATKTREAQATPTIDADGFWHCEVALEIGDTDTAGRKESARQTVFFDLMLKPTGAGFTVSIKGLPEKFTLPAEAGATGHTAFFEFLFQQMVASYRRPGQRFFETLADSRRTIGG